MNPFQYVNAGSPDEAVSLIGKNGRYLGGGIDLLDEMKGYIVSPDILVDVKGITFLSHIQPISEPPVGKGDLIEKHDASGQAAKTPNYWNIGALVTVADLANHPDLKTSIAALSEAASEVGSPQIRNVATLGGNLLQHSRCWYYRQPDITCLKRGGTTCYGQEGENKYLSLYSGCACISPIVSNLSIALTALEASINFTADRNHRTMILMKIGDLYAEAWKNATAHNSLKSNDLFLGVNVPAKRTRSAYRQVSEKNEFDWALVSCAAAGNVTDGKITDARVVLGAVAPVPYMVKAANHYLEGKPLTDETVSHAADIILKDAKPLAQNGYKVPLAHALIRRTLLALNS